MHPHTSVLSPLLDQRTREIQAYGTVSHALPLELEEPVRLEMTEHLNQLLADTMTLRDLYKKSHWQVVGATFYQLYLLYDKHYNEQVELVDSIAERIQLLGGVSLAMASDIYKFWLLSEHLADALDLGDQNLADELARLLHFRDCQGAVDLSSIPSHAEDPYRF